MTKRGPLGYQVVKPRPMEIHDGRLKWTCPSCHKRNATKLMAPVFPVEVHNCKFCHRPSTFSFAQEPTVPG